MSDAFLARWSRRKSDARRAKDDATPSAERSIPPVEPALSEGELAALPKPDELTAESDITCFLRRGVPEALRNTALRRMWLLDPAIRDFPGHARDYAWDWNTPGGVPGNGALDPGVQLVAAARQVLDDGLSPPRVQDEPGGRTGSGDEERAASPQNDRNPEPAASRRQS